MTRRGSAYEVNTPGEAGEVVGEEIDRPPIRRDGEGGIGVDDGRGNDLPRPVRVVERDARDLVLHIVLFLRQGGESFK